MRCKKIQELILTDYTDREMTAFSRQRVKDHIKGCANCRVFEERLKEKIITPLQETEHVQPPEAVWLRIKEAVGEPEHIRIMERVTDFLDSLFIARKPVLVAASLLVLMLVGGFFARTYFAERNIVNAYMAEQVDFLDSLDNDDGYTDEYNGFLSEDFFL
ncbi:MAG: zf-HC2 domain-containing protein [Candidatus Omnitrophota bacterium]